MFNPSRDQVRRFFIDAWRKYRARTVLSALEYQAVDIVLQHAEYHGVLEHPDALMLEYAPEGGEMNPFLHLSLHLAIEEQLAIGQPHGIRQAFDGLLVRCADRHEALHRVLECLGETIWCAQRAGTALDAESYLECVRKSAS